ncbi:hypothetical protein WUBG_02819 [Wuchereria bancrofti]|nr:hypothetical protein WUBG_02819 [Wuchereria bancrofti]
MAMKTTANKNGTVEFQNYARLWILKKLVLLSNLFIPKVLDIFHYAIWYRRYHTEEIMVLNAKGQLKECHPLMSNKRSLKLKRNRTGIGRRLPTTTEGMTEGRKGRNKSTVCSSAALGSLTIDQGL